MVDERWLTPTDLSLDPLPVIGGVDSSQLAFSRHERDSLIVTSNNLFGEPFNTE